MKCVICIPTRNTEKYLKKIYKNILKIREAFDKLIVCFYYDVSDDLTLKILEELKDDYDGEFEILKNEDKLLDYRTHRIANARNKLLEFIYNKHSDSDYFIMMDSDEICSYNIDINVLKKHLDMDKNIWDGLSFNRSGLPEGHDNYDIWALQYEPFIHHCHSYNGRLDVVYMMRDDITKKLNSLKKNELFECYSAFNGFAIYRTNKFKNIKYDGITQKYFSDEKIFNMLNRINQKYNLNLTINFDYVDNSHGGGKQNCEHIGFHINAIFQNNAKIRISGEKIFMNN